MNDPVGIALMIGMIELATHEDGDFSIVVSEFAVEMTLGLLVGVAGALALLPVMRARPADEPGAVSDPGTRRRGNHLRARLVRHRRLGLPRRVRRRVLLGDVAAAQGRDRGVPVVALRARGDRRVRRARPHGRARGPRVRRDLARRVVLALILAFVARPLAILPLLAPAGSAGRALFIAWGGLKGAVPILLGALAVLSGVDDAGGSTGSSSSSSSSRWWCRAASCRSSRDASRPVPACRPRPRGGARVRRSRRRLRERPADRGAPARRAGVGRRAHSRRRPRRLGERRARARRSRARLLPARGRGRARAHLRRIAG